MITKFSFEIRHGRQSKKALELMEKKPNAKLTENDFPFGTSNQKFEEASLEPLRICNYNIKIIQIVVLETKDLDFLKEAGNSTFSTAIL